MTIITVLCYTKVLNGNIISAAIDFQFLDATTLSIGLSMFTSACCWPQCVLCTFEFSGLRIHQKSRTSTGQSGTFTLWLAVPSIHISLSSPSQRLRRAS